MAGKYWWEEYKQQDSTQQSGSKRYWWDDGSIATTIGENISSRVNTWLENHNNYITNYQNRTKNRKYNYEDSYVSDSADWLETVSRQKSNFDAEADSILSYMDQNKAYLDAEWMDSVRNTLTEARKNQNAIVDYSAKDNQWWSNFKDAQTYRTEQRKDGYQKKYTGMTSEELSGILDGLKDSEEKDWLSAYKSSVEYDEYSKMDTQALQKDIAEKETVLKEAESIIMKTGFNSVRDKELYDRVRDIIGQYSGGAYFTVDDLKAELSKQTQKLNNANRIQNGIQMAGVADKTSEHYDPEFSQYTGYTGSTWIDGGVDRFFSWDKSAGMKTGYNDIRYDFINDPDAVTNVLSKSANDADLHLLSGLQPYRHMTEDQVSVYNYYYAKHGKEKADEYLKTIQEELNAQQGETMFKTMENKTVLEEVFGIAAGLDQAVSGVRNFFSNEDYIPTSPIQYTSGYVREDLKDNGATMPDWLGGGSLGQGVYDFITTTSNMAPSILLSSAIGALNPTAGMVAGNALMGTSAAGNAYQQVLNQGYGKEAARTYSTAVGASEVLLGSLLGGISKLGGISPKLAQAVAGIDNGLLRFSLQYGGKIASEALEEGLQERLDPVFRNAILHADEDVDWSQVAYSALLGGLSAGFMEGVGTAGEVVMDQNLKKLYNDNTNALIQEGLESDIDSDSYKLAQKYQAQVQGKDGKTGKAMTGAQIRNLLAANQEQITPKDMKLIQTAAQKRLTELGQTENVEQIAELATKRATGQKLSKEETSILAHSQYGARVANELLPENIESGNYSTSWAEDIGTRKVNTESYNKKIREILDHMESTKDPNAYKSLEERVGKETKLSVSEEGKTTVHGSEAEIDLKKARVTDIVRDQRTGKVKDMTMDIDGQEVKASDIEYSDENLAHLFSAVSQVEHITPDAATVAVRDYDPASGQSAGEYLNGFDEGFTYGYYGYSVEDLKAGNFAPKLTDTQMMSAYRMGQAARSAGDINADAPIIKMRTAAQAKMTAQMQTEQQKARIESGDTEVYFEDGGKVVKFDERSGKYDKKRMAAVNTAKFLSKLGIGGKYYFYESYVNAKGERVYKDADGNEVEAPNGLYRDSDGSIHIDLNAGDYGQGTALFTMGHELAHFIKAQSKTQFKSLANLVTEAFSKTDMSMHDRVVAKQKFLEEKRGEHVSYDEAYEEVVADAMSTMLSDGSFYEKLMEIKVKDKGLFNTIKKFFKKMIAKFNEVYAKLTPDQQDAQDIRAMKDMFDKIQTAFVEGLVVASDNFHASEQVLAQSGISVNTETESGSLQSVRTMLNDADKKKAVKALADRFGVTEKEAMDWLKAETSLASLILNPKYSQFLDYEADPNEVAIKQNSDYPQGTVDFSNICKKRREFTQVMNRILRNFPNHVFAATDLAKIRTIMGEEGMTLPCGICYVEDRRQLDTIVAQDFINSLKLYREGSKTRPDGKPFNANQLKGLQLTDGDTYVPTIYELVSLEGRNSLKAKNPNMEAAWVRYNNARGMQAVRLLTNEAEYKRQILKYNNSTVQSKNDHGGLRIYSFSDAEMFHLIDIIQVITDSATVGLKLQGYTKVNEYAKAVKDTGEKLNRSLIPKGDLGYHMENGKVVLDYDTVEGIDIYSKDFFDNKDNPDVGNITIGINDVQIRAAMVSDFVDQIIPFHTGQSEEVLGEKGIAAWDNYKDFQTEKDLSTGKTSSHQVNIYTEVFQAAEAEGKTIQNKRQFVEKFLQVCKDNGLQPRFSQFLNTDANGDYVYTEGYHKFLVDFKTFAQTEVGEYLPQMPVKPIFEDAYITGLLEAYVKEQQEKDAEVAQQMPKVIERITNEIVKPGEKRSDRKSSVENQDRNRYSSRYEKRFFPGNVFPSGQTHTAITNWANRMDVKTGEKRLVLYKGEYYRVEKFDNMDFGYLITKKYDAQDYDEELIEYGEIDSEESVQSGFDEIVARSGETTEHGSRGYHADSFGSGYGSEDNRLREMDEEEYGWRENSSQIERDRQDGLRDQRQTGRSIRLEYTPQELYDKMLDLDRKLVFAKGRYATRLINQRERYASMIDDMRGWDRVRLSERGEGASNRDLLANAFEGITKGSDEYRLIQQYKSHVAELNSLEEKLTEFNREIRKIRFTAGERDTERLRRLENEADKIVDAINKHDKKLLSLEASEPLRKVIERERKKESQKTKEHVKEIQQNRKLRAEQTELRGKIRRVIRDLDKLLKHGNKKLNVKEDLQPVVTKALQAADILFTENYSFYDMLRNGIGADLSDSEEALVKTCAQMLKDLDQMPTDGYDNWQAYQAAENKIKAKMSKLKDVFARERKRLNNTTVSSILGELADAYAKLDESSQSYVQGAYSEPVYNFLKNLQSEVGGTIVQDMTKAQLESVYAAYKMVLSAVRNANKMFNEELKETKAQLGNAVIEEVRNAGGVHLLGTKMGDKISRFDWNNTKPIWVANRIGSETFGKLMHGLFNGQYNFAVDVAEAKKFKLEMDKKYNPRSWDAEKLYDFTSSTGKEFSLNLQQIMSLYAFSKREQSWSHLLNGGFVFENNSTVLVDTKLGIKKAYIHKGATSYKLNEATLNDIINSLTNEQKAYVDEMQKYLSEVMGAKGNEVSMKLYGIEMFKEKFYFPLRSSGAYMERAKEAEMKKQQGQINLVNSGFTHAVKPEAKNPIILSSFLDVWSEHCNEMSMYHGMVLPMEDFRKVYNYSTVHDEKMESASVFQTIQDSYGDAATNYIDQLYRELNAGATIDPRETDFKAWISKFKKSAVMLSASVVVQQFSSVGRAFAVIDPKHFVGVKVNSDTQMSVAEEMKKYAPVAIIKEMGGFDTGTKGSAKSYIMAEQYGKGERLQGLRKDAQYRSDVMGYLPAKADEKTWCVIWEAVKRETKAMNTNMDIKSEEFLKLAGERFSEVIEKTQVYDSVLARSANMRSKGAFMAMATAFMAEPTTTINLIEDAIRSGKARTIARTFGAVATSIVLNNALSSIVYAMRDDDEDETFIEKYFQSFASGMIDDINPMSYYPFFKDVYSLFQGYDVERADMSVIADLRDALKKAAPVIGKDTSEMDDEELAAHRKNVAGVLMSILDAGCSMFGVPEKNIRRDVHGLINAWNTVKADATERDTSWNTFWDKVGSAAKDTIPFFAWTKDKSKPDKLYDAILSGDKAYVDRLRSTYKSESSYQNAVRKALRENDPRIKEAAMAQINGNPSERVRITKLIKADGFAQDDVVTAINSEINAMTKSESGSGATKIKGLYKTEDFVREYANGDMASIGAIREDILDTAQKNGKTLEEAEEDFVSDVRNEAKDLFLSGSLGDAEAEKLLREYAGMDSEEATAKVSYWAFCKAHPESDLSQSNVEEFHEWAEPAGISLDVFVQYIEGTKGLETKYDEWGDVELSKKEQVLEVIDSLPLTWQQKDALYLAAGYSKSNIWDVPW